MVETGRAERVADVVVQPLVLAEHDAREHGATLTVDAVQATNERTAKPVGEPADPTARADDAPLVRAQQDVHAAPAQEPALVEVLAGLRLCELAEELELGALRRCPAGRQLQLHRLGHHPATEAQHPRSDAHLVLRATCGAGHDGQRIASRSHVAEEDAPIERVESHAPPPPARESERHREQGEPRVQVGHCREPGERSDGERGDEHTRAAYRVGEREAADERSREQMRPPVHEHVRHGATSSDSCASRAGPIPGIASSSRTELNAPCFSR